MTETAIRVQNVSKKFEIGELVTTRDMLRLPGRAVRWPLRRLGLIPPEDRSGRELWALRDVSFDVGRGESLGIIGGNGAGKSTLLKILSRITAPTLGRIELYGRVASLLEVGTGMHPELTGRENVYLNGAILGMSRAEVRRKFDEIVSFAGVERFIDTPIKRYSSGMRVRLGFAVAAHLEPEILIVDEVLAVGDAEFQRRCIGKMSEVARGGHTVLFVSHNMGSIQALCDRAIVLSAGRVIGNGPPDEAVKLYLQSTLREANLDIGRRADRGGRGHSRIVRASIHSDGYEDAPGLVFFGQTAQLEVEISRVLPGLACKFTIYSHFSGSICRFTSLAAAPGDGVIDGNRFICEIPELPLLPGEYRVNIAIQTASAVEDHVESALSFRVEHGSLAGRALAPGQAAGVFVPRHRWIVPRCSKSS